MKIIKLTYPHSFQKEELPKTVTALGFFDGIHKGHQTVIRQAVLKANQLNMESAVITFYPHPSVILKNNHDVKYITPIRDKQEVIESLGVDRLYIVSFTKELSSLSPQEFIDHFIVGLNIHHVVAGFDFTYGHRGQGNMETIGQHAKGSFEFTTIDKVTLGNEKISSTRIRNLLGQGDLEQVNALLGRPFITRGSVIKGASRGREIGYPTANIDYMEEALLPKPGIYAVKVKLEDGLFLGMASLGTNPTFTEDRKDLSLEVNILDFKRDIYGKELVVEWYKYIRDEEKFNSVDELVQKIAEDEKSIRNYFA